jgi:anthranilate phosphoribosyltransferase
MAKKKGATLSELNEFLSKDPNSLTDVEKLSEKHHEEPASVEVSTESIAGLIAKLSIREKESHTKTLLKIILRSLEEKGEESPADILLMNTALYLLHAENTGEKLNDLLKN